MKTSNRILVWIGAALVVLTLAGVIVSKVVVNSRVINGQTLAGTTETQTRTLSGDYVTSSYDLSGFTSIQTAGAWDVSVKAGDAFEVRLQVQKDALDAIVVERLGDRLSIGFRPEYRLRNAKTFYAYVTLPDLEGMASSGAANVKMDGFDGDSLVIKSSGALNLTGSDNTYKSLSVDSSGAANVDLKSSKVNQANVDVSGAGNIALRMTGGPLTGKISGVSKITYYGDVSNVSVNSSGFSSVSRGKD